MSVNANMSVSIGTCKTYIYRSTANMTCNRYPPRRELKDKAIAHLGGKCADCGGVFNRAAFDFHHLDPSQKDLAIAAQREWSVVEAELTKCVLLCSNCHRIRHAIDE